MDSLKLEIEKKRKSLGTPTNGAQGSKKKKYISRAEIEKQREQEYLKAQDELERKRELVSSNENEKAENSTPNSEVQKEENDGSDTFNISQEEVIRRLRAKGQPIRLFGESDKDRKTRLRALELIEERSEGQRNDFMKTLEEMETGLDLEILKKQPEEDISRSSKKKRPIEDLPLDNTPIEVDLIEKDSDKLYVLIYTFFKRLLREWEHEMNNRPDHIKRSTQGKFAAATQKQTNEYMQPFFRTLKKKAIEPDVLARITEITHYMQKREYMNANDAYLRLSIGNAPWPIGNIHERSAREKIFSAQVAHVLNDETTRKWIQSIKRLMTFCQTKYPPQDNSQLMG
ncbi:potassium channel regulatory factor [Gigaspora rosea]|uniref:Pre-mRNA-splicing factor 18 n=1 Tax=Gigaspora rosea TaxID=44941 RepID=A0A397USQ9_9GLOM|nr:potassium channel regulatory factor [Gigaspora rosea]